MKNYNIFTINLKNTQIIEASAGTGKTFTIILLYLRLLLGLNNKKNNKKYFSIQEILVVTLSNVAKSELIERIYKYISKLKKACIKRQTNDNNLKIFIKKIKNFKKSIQILEEAKKNIEQASIYTFHKFCKKMLSFYQYKYLITKNYSLIDNEEELYLSSTINFWRKYLYNCNYEIIEIILNKWKNPTKFLKNIYQLLRKKKQLFNNKEKLNFFKKCEKIKSKISYFKKRWMLKKVEIISYLKKDHINKRIYNKKNIFRWVSKIDNWALSTSSNYRIPKELNYFLLKKIESKKTTIKNFKKIHFFKEIEYFLKKKYSIEKIFFIQSLKEIPEIIKKEKKKNLVYEFDDLINWFNKLLNKKKILNDIKKKYPIAFIDEFQDTDLNQYNVFKKIYFQDKKTTMIIIGDPKQSIYSFRGSDINVFLKAKKEIPSYCQLNTNFRSSKNMVESINFLFSRIKYPFLLKEIKFYPSIPSKKNETIKFLKNKKIQSAIEMLVVPEKIQKTNTSKKWLAEQFAIKIFNWINQKKIKYQINIKNKIYKIKKKDITILVKNKIENKIIQKELNKLSIENKYVSEKKSIYKTQESREILIILKSILDEYCEKKFITALSTNLMNQNIYDLELIANNYKKKSYWRGKFNNYKLIWKKNSIYQMFQKFINENNKLNPKSINEKKKQIINLLHIGELLQKKSTTLKNKNLLINWLEKKVFFKNKKIKKTEIIRNVFNNDCIKIINIHASKGLEFPIVLIPFSTSYNSILKNSILEHEITKKNLKNIKNKSTKINHPSIFIEKLSEDLRLLYVALTRSIFYSILGVEIQKKNNKNLESYSRMHLTAIGHLIQKGKKLNSKEFLKETKKIKKYINIISEEKKIKINKKNNLIFFKKNEKKINLKKKSFSITSYSKIKKENQRKNKIKLKIKNYFSSLSYSEKNKINLDQHSFPRGIKSGLLIHEILKNINFSKPIKEKYIEEKLIEYNLEKKYKEILLNWINNIVSTNLDKKSLSLSNLKKNQYIKELNFFLPIKNTLNQKKLFIITKKFDKLSKSSSNLTFSKKKGIITGSIDLIFLWKKKYYILDYKSNWLGNNEKSYSIKNIQLAMVKNQYCLQYQIYSLAMHRYLKSKIKNYNFEKYFGGIIYFFIRAVDKNKDHKYGVFKTNTNKNQIKKLEKLF
ncbi:RecBCD enzyme subunit RecB [Buchnera aphidicola (Tetraneura ulmi)]|uniref:exodeoxyribonuclease V subunit beta n=1 Tax=Buchnera aphidicola TaxID=9 RepID=UPI003463C3D4